MPDQKALFPVTHKYANKNGVLYPATQPFVKIQGTLYPVTHMFVVKKKPADFLDEFTGLIYEYYNTMPWMGTWFYGMGTAMDFKIACTYINFASHTEDYGGGLLWTEQDQFGLIWQRVNRDGDNSVYGGGMSWQDSEAYERANGGGGGLVFSAVEPYKFEGWYDDVGDYLFPNQPVNSVGVNCRFAELSVNAASSGADNTWEFGWLGGSFVGNCLYMGYRSKDMVMWVYEMSYGGAELDTTGIPDDALFLPGQSGIKKISNSYKYAPWERYPHLHSF